MKKILVIGDIIFDKYVEVEVNRKSQENKDVDVYDKVSEFTRLGGAANVAANIVSLAGNECEVHRRYD